MHCGPNVRRVLEVLVSQVSWCDDPVTVPDGREIDKGQFRIRCHTNVDAAGFRHAVAVWHARQSATRVGAVPIAVLEILKRPIQSDFSMGFRRERENPVDHKHVGVPIRVGVCEKAVLVVEPAVSNTDDDPLAGDASTPEWMILRHCIRRGIGIGDRLAGLRYGGRLPVRHDHPRGGLDPLHDVPVSEPLDGPRNVFQPHIQLGSIPAVVLQVRHREIPFDGPGPVLHGRQPTVPKPSFLVVPPDALILHKVTLMGDMVRPWPMHDRKHRPHPEKLLTSLRD